MFRDKQLFHLTELCRCVSVQNKYSFYRTQISLSHVFQARETNSSGSKRVVCSPGRQTWVRPNADFMLFWTAKNLDCASLTSMLPNFCHHFYARNCKFVTAYIRSPIWQMPCSINQCLPHWQRWWQNVGQRQIRLKPYFTLTERWHNVTIIDWTIIDIWHIVTELGCCWCLVNVPITFYGIVIDKILLIFFHSNWNKMP